MLVRHRSARRHRRLRGRNGRPGGGVRGRRLSLGFALQGMSGPTASVGMTAEPGRTYHLIARFTCNVIPR